MDFIKKNPALAVGVGLPCLVVVLFFLATVIPEWTVPPPSYDALFDIEMPCCATHTPDNNQTKMSVSGRHLKAYRRKWPSQGYQVSDTQLFLFDAKTLSVRQIFIPPSSAASEDWQEFSIPDAEALTIDPGTTAADGYQFLNHYDYHNEVWPFFGSGYGNETISLHKNGRQIKLTLPNADGPVYNTNIHFLGWVLSRSGP